MVVSTTASFDGTSKYYDRALTEFEFSGWRLTDRGKVFWSCWCLFGKRRKEEEQRCGVRTTQLQYHEVALMSKAFKCSENRYLSYDLNASILLRSLPLVIRFYEEHQSLLEENDKSARTIPQNQRRRSEILLHLFSSGDHSHSSVFSSSSTSLVDEIHLLSFGLRMVPRNVHAKGPRSEGHVDKWVKPSVASVASRSASVVIISSRSTTLHLFFFSVI
eukprot:TRINITY_DN10327_c0_g1_i1.p1 TRINITY_DN10327_c0_g1~~TRINITY_DN10327_c0_g1_i1.p1  ORF type:complete len:218 (+),score=14.26 TRINITY_DN10327_c0_g1_i1:358-1011(+)